MTDQDRARWKTNFAHIVLSCPIAILEEIAGDIEEKTTDAVWSREGDLLHALCSLAFEYRAEHAPKENAGKKVLRL